LSFHGPKRITDAAKLLGAQMKKKDIRDNSRQEWDQKAFLEKMNEISGMDATAVAEKLIAWLNPRAVGKRWGSGSLKHFRPRVIFAGKEFPLLEVRPDGSLYINLKTIPETPPFDDSDSRQALLNRLNQISCMDLTEEDYGGGWPFRPIAVLAKETAFRLFEDAYDWVERKMEEAGNWPRPNDSPSAP
jgi:hypothetical protein